MTYLTFPSLYSNHFYSSFGAKIVLNAHTFLNPCGRVGHFLDENKESSYTVAGVYPKF